MKTLKDLMSDFVHDYDRELTNTHALWSWLPSYEFAKLHFSHGCPTPSSADVMYEATLFMCVFRGHEYCKEEVISWFYVDTDCLENPPTDDEKLEKIKAWFTDIGITLNVKS